MTDRLKEAWETWEEKKGNLDRIEESDELIRDWLDDKVDAIIAVNKIYEESPKYLCMGEFEPDKGEYEVEICTCDYGRYADVLQWQIYKGIKRLAAAVDKPLKVEPLKNYGKEYSFLYRNIQFFEIEKEGDNKEND